jgi:hypothetical protein
MQFTASVGSTGATSDLLRCRRIDARNATIGSDKATSSRAIAANRPLQAFLTPRQLDSWVGATNIQVEGAVTPASCSGDRGLILSAG